MGEGASCQCDVDFSRAIHRREPGRTPPYPPNALLNVPQKYSAGRSPWAASVRSFTAGMEKAGVLQRSAAAPPNTPSPCASSTNSDAPGQSRRTVS